MHQHVHFDLLTDLHRKLLHASSLCMPILNSFSEAAALSFEFPSALLEFDVYPHSSFTHLKHGFPLKQKYNPEILRRCCTFHFI